LPNHALGVPCLVHCQIFPFHGAFWPVHPISFGCNLFFNRLKPDLTIEPSVPPGISRKKHALSNVALVACTPLRVRLVRQQTTTFHNSRQVTPSLVQVHHHIVQVSENANTSLRVLMPQTMFNSRNLVLLRQPRLQDTRMLSAVLFFISLALRCTKKQSTIQTLNGHF
jgi:hypothetical protein